MQKASPFSTATGVNLKEKVVDLVALALKRIAAEKVTDGF